MGTTVEARRYPPNSNKAPPLQNNSKSGRKDGSNGDNRNRASENMFRIAVKSQDKATRFRGNAIVVAE